MTHLRFVIWDLHLHALNFDQAPHLSLPLQKTTKNILDDSESLKTYPEELFAVDGLRQNLQGADNIFHVVSHLM